VHAKSCGGIDVPIDAGGVRRSIAFSDKVVSEAMREDLLERSGGGVRLSASGASRLSRALERDAPFLAQHRPLVRERVDVDGAAEAVLVDTAESPLAWLRRRRGKTGQALVAEHAFLAGEKLRSDYTQACLMPRITANWQAPVGRGARPAAGGLDLADIVVAARQRVGRALDAVGPELSGVLVDVCCFLKGLELVESERGWPVRSAKVVLLLGLERLASHYGMGSEARGRQEAAVMRFWGAEDYRPER
jgi:hypothetical protein